MKLSDSDFCGFACPQTGLNESLLQSIVVEHSRQTLEAFLGRNTNCLKLCTENLIPVLSDWLDYDGSFAAAWSLPFGELYASFFSSDPHDSQRAASAVALQLHEHGHEGEWKAMLDQPTRFRFSRYLLPAGTHIEVSASPKTFTVRTGLGGKWHEGTFYREGVDWLTTDLSPLATVQYSGVSWPVLTADSLSPASAGRLLQADVYNFSQEGADTDFQLLLRTANGALSLVEQAAPPYLRWVARVVRNLVPLPAIEGTLNSASGNLAPGCIAVSNQTRRSILAEMLVHEATHQYLYILKRLGPIDDGSDPELYFSPFKNTGRPILYILFAYHAFGNVLLFYRSARQQGLSSDEHGSDIDEQIQRFATQLNVLEQSLEKSKALTSLGRALWQPLREQINR